MTRKEILQQGFEDFSLELINKHYQLEAHERKERVSDGFLPVHEFAVSEGLSKSSALHMEHYFDDVKQITDPDTGDVRLDIYDAKATCIYPKTDYSELHTRFKWRMDKGVGAYRKFIGKAYDTRGYKLPLNTNYGIWLLRIEGLWWADLSDILRCVEVENGFWEVPGCFELRYELTVSEKNNYKAICKVLNRGV